MAATGVLAVRQCILELNCPSRLPGSCLGHRKSVQTDLSWWDLMRQVRFGGSLKSSSAHWLVHNYDPIALFHGRGRLSRSIKQLGKRGMCGWMGFWWGSPGATLGGSGAVPRQGADILRRRDEFKSPLRPLLLNSYGVADGFALESKLERTRLHFTAQGPAQDNRLGEQAVVFFYPLPHSRFAAACARARIASSSALSTRPSRTSNCPATHTARTWV